MQRQNMMLVVVGVLVLIALIFMGWAATRPLPSADADATPTLPITMTAAASAESLPGDVIATEFFTMTLPTGWQATSQTWTGDQPEGMTHLAPLIVAWPGEGAFEQSRVRFSIAAMPRNALSLEQYLVDVTEQFSGAAGMSNVDIALVTDLRQDGLPAAMVTYAMTTPAGAFTGYQAATFDALGTQLLIATLVHEASVEDGDRVFRDLVGSLHLLAPAN
jgi:hypothetical protein